MRKSTTFYLLFGILFMLLPGMSDPACALDKSASEVVVIGNRRLPFDSLGAGELKDIFQRKKTMWEDGQKISFALLDSGKTHQHFVRLYIQKTPAQYHRYWKKMVFSGRGIPPMSFRDENSLMAHIALTAGSIGYVSHTTKLFGVKRIQIIEESAAVSETTAADESSPIQNGAQTKVSEVMQENKTESIFNRFFD